MRIVPLFLHAEFEGEEIQKPTVLTPVKAIHLAYINQDGELDRTGYGVGTADDVNMWADTAEYIRQVAEQVPGMQVVGWDLRNRDWPAVVNGIVRHGLKFPKQLLLPLDEKWNRAPLVDLRNVFLQGGFMESDKGPSLDDAWHVLLGGEKNGADPLDIISAIYERYNYYF